MKVAFNVQPLKTGHKTRGVGSYTKNLLDELKATDLDIQEFDDINEVSKADIVYYPWFDLFFKSLKLNRKIPTVITVHDVMPLLYAGNYPLGIKGKINFYLQKRALRKCQRIITISKCSKKDIVQHLDIKEDKITVIPEAANKEFKLLSEAKLLTHKRKYNLPDHFLLYVGDANFVKNLPFLIEGFKLLKQDQSFKEMKLVLIGGVFLKKVDNIDHPEIESLKRLNKLISEYKLDEFIIKPGQVSEEELVCFYNLATVYIQPSLYEGFGLPILEAMSCGTPVLSSKSSSLPEVGGEAVIYFDPNNVNQFVTLLKDLLNDKSLQIKLSKLGIKRAQLFSWEKVADNVKKVFESCL